MEGAEALPTVFRPTTTAVGRGANGRERVLFPWWRIVPVSVSSPPHYFRRTKDFFLRCTWG
eukprot:1822518-Pyramimonas_sp.AAC.1